MKHKGPIWLLVLAFAILVSAPSWAENVKITPLGAAAGEFCAGDRALLFEDPTGVRVLIAPGRTVGKDLGAFVRGSADDRLAGRVDVLLIDHPHTDHIGDVFHTTCAGAPTKAFEFPREGNASEIAAKLNSAVLVGGELPDFFTKKIANVLGVPVTAVAGCPTNVDAATGLPFLDSRFTVPRTSPCVGVIRGGTRTAIVAGQANGVKITTIPAFHAAGASRTHVDELESADPQGGIAVADPGVPEGLTGYAGHETGYILRFTNGLSVLWTGDSGLIGDWQVQAKFYKVNLAVVHGGDLFTMGPDEAAFAVKELIRPKTTIPEHFNQVSTTGGVVNPGTRLERFLSQVKGRARVVVPLSGQTFEFDGNGKCVAGPGC